MGAHTGFRHGLKVLNGKSYSPLRRAYFPSAWPMILVSAPVSFVCAFYVRTVWLAISGCVLVGVIVPQARLYVWRRRHPQITGEQLMQDMRDQARWN